MLTLLIAFGAFVGYLVAYHTYGRWLSRKIFKLDPEAVDPEDVETLEDMVMLAVNNALAEGQKIQAEEMAKVTAGMNLPGLG